MSKYMLLAFLVVILAIVIVEIDGRRRWRSRTVYKYRQRIVFKRRTRGKRSIEPEFEPRYLPCDFDCLDKNKDGSVTFKELENALQKRVPRSLLQEAVKLVFKTIDLNSDELLIQDEFDQYYNEKEACILDDLEIQTMQ